MVVALTGIGDVARIDALAAGGNPCLALLPARLVFDDQPSVGLLDDIALRAALTIPDWLTIIGNGQRRPPEDPTIEELVGAYRQIIQRAHDCGLKIFGATLTPYEGASYYSVAGEAKRQALNNFIRTSGEFDGVIDFEKATRDPAAPTKWNAAVQRGDNLHPNQAGYEAMAAAIDLKMFGVK